MQSPILTSPLPTLPTQPSPYSPPKTVAPSALEAETLADDCASLQAPSVPEPSTQVLSVSTAFNLGTFPTSRPPDTVLVSSDETLFYIHGKILSKTSFWSAVAGGSAEQRTSADAGRSAILLSVYPCPLPQDSKKVWLKVMNVTADELNIILHALYNTSCAIHSPTVGTLDQAIDKMASLFGISVNTVICPGNEVYNYLLNIMPLQPLRIYALAAHHRIHTMAVRASSHLLSYPIGAISDEECLRMGAIYLRKLIILQMERKERLVELLFSPPRPHPSIPGCGQGESKLVEALWAGALVNLTYDMRAGEFFFSFEELAAG